METTRMRKYTGTIYACFTGLVVQAVIINFAPLLFLTFQNTYQISLTKITFLITMNFIVQLLTDLVAIGVIKRLGYRVSIVLAHVCCAIGLVGMAILPEVLNDAFSGLAIATICYAIGGGLLEVLVSPIVEACPTENKGKAMSLLHSFYCWGQVGVILLSTIYFSVVGIEQWQSLCLLWAILPTINMIAFLRVPIAELHEEQSSVGTICKLLTTKIFWVFVIIMICAGASEQAVAQWGSTFAEQALGVSKAIGDLTGPMTFAIMMGIARAIYGKYGENIHLERFIVASAALCIVCFLLISLTQNPIIGLLGCSIAGFSVGIMWPGTFSMAAATIKGGGVSLFALLALAGDFGCMSGPTVVGMVSSATGGDFRKGIEVALIFPIVLIVGIYVRSRMMKPKRLQSVRQ